MNARKFIGYSCFTAALLFAATGALAAPAQSPLADSIHQGAHKAAAEIRASLAPRPLLKAPAIVSPWTADAGVGHSIAAASRQAMTTIRRAQHAEIMARSATLLAAAMQPARPRQAEKVALWQRTFDAGNGQILEIIRSIAENAAIRWLPEVSLRIPAPSALSAR